MASVQPTSCRGAARSIARACSPRHAVPCTQRSSNRRTIAVLATAAGATPSPGATTPPKDPFAEMTVYNDNMLDLLFIKLYSQKMAAQLPAAQSENNVTVPEDAKWEDFVRVSKEIMRGRNSLEQKEVVLNVLASLLPPDSPRVFRTLFPPTKFSAEFNALIAAYAFKWLVGEMELVEADIQVGPNEVRKQRSIVKIKKCRYLESSGCVGMCVNMCKIPTQTFFTEDFGLPLTMKPNFEDLSCEMIFGQAPLAPELDEAFKQPCFIRQCNLGTNEAAPPCPKTNDNARLAAVAKGTA